jgi:hypothetical protein
LVLVEAVSQLTSYLAERTILLQVLQIAGDLVLFEHTILELDYPPNHLVEDPYATTNRPNLRGVSRL